MQLHPLIDDAKNILQKLEQFGPWTRLGQLFEKQRITELTERAKRQLLVGLFEATSGIGYEKMAHGARYVKAPIERAWNLVPARQ